MKWIKASERFPKDGIGVLKCIWVRSIQTKCGTMMALDTFLKLDSIENVEWLDESQSPVPDKVDEAVELVKFVKNLGYMNGEKPQYEFTPEEILSSFKSKQ